MVVYDNKFLKAFNYVISNEGEYVYNPSDPGGETKYGISHRSYPTLNIKKLTLEDAKKIYYCDYWLKGKCDKIEDEKVATQVFDFIVNFGHRAATIVLQRSLRACGVLVAEDGLCGPMTLCGTNFLKGEILLPALKSEAAGYYRVIAAKNPSQQKFLNGWLNRAYRQI